MLDRCLLFILVVAQPCMFSTTTRIFPLLPISGIIPDKLNSKPGLKTEPKQNGIAKFVPQAIFILPFLNLHSTHS